MNARRKMSIAVGLAAGLAFCVAVLVAVKLNSETDRGLRSEQVVETYSADLHDFVPEMMEGFSSSSFSVAPTNGTPRATVDRLQVKRVTSVADRVTVLYDAQAAISGITNSLPVSVKVSFGLACIDGKLEAKDVAVDRVQVYTADRKRTVVECDHDKTLAAKVKSLMAVHQMPFETGTIKFLVDNKVRIEKGGR